MIGKPQRLSDRVHVFAEPGSLRYEADQAEAQALRDAIDLEEQIQRSGSPATQPSRLGTVPVIALVVAVVVLIILAVAV